MTVKQTLPLSKLSILGQLTRLAALVAGVFWSINLQAHPLFDQGEAASEALTELSDDDLVQLCLYRGARDDRAFREIFRRHQATIWRVCYSFVRNREDAEDLMQEVFFRAYRSLAQFQGRASLRTWLYQIASNVSKNEIRRLSRRPQESNTPVEDMSEYLSGGGSPEKQVMAAIQIEQLTEAMAHLKPDMAQALRMKDLEQMSYVEIAETLDISQSAAKMRVQRARLALGRVYHQITEG